MSGHCVDVVRRKYDSMDAGDERAANGAVFFDAETARLMKMLKSEILISTPDRVFLTRTVSRGLGRASLQLARR